MKFQPTFNIFVADTRSPARNLEVAPALRLAQLQTIYEGTLGGFCFLDRKLRYTYRMHVSDATYGLVRSRGTPRHDEHGQIHGWYGLLEDIDDRDPHEP